MTNYEKFMSKSLDELAEYIYKNDHSFLDEVCRKSSPCPHGENVEEYNCINCVKVFLESEVEDVDSTNTLTLGKCWGCGKPIPELLVENGKFNFRCQKCGAETRFQDTIYDAVDIWNEGRTYSFDEAAFMAVVTGKVSCYKDALSLKNPLTALE